ncbi:MAG: molybdopterin-binding protein [Minwuia sp.]|uniref:molybdopterin-binding protein n=1 Tax=Minwuia sp. TaxID=2493630 RepID=UPI003A8B9B7E
MADYDMMGKTELSLHGLELADANLTHVADAVAKVLVLDRTEILVTDVRGDNLVLDILRRGIDAKNIVGKERELLDAVAAVEGVGVAEDARVESRGLLSWVSADSEGALEQMEAAERQMAEIREKLEKTVVVFPTGTELANGQVKDTNSPAIREKLTVNGYAVSQGMPLKDDEYYISAAIRERAEEGFGMVVTTGGVGAEVKDRTIEAVLIADPDASTPTIVEYELGVGRHVHKNAVRIAVGQVLDTMVVALPGPTDEVLLGLDALVRALTEPGLSNPAIAERIADVLRKRLREKAHAHA